MPKNAHKDGGLQSQIGNAPPNQAGGFGSPRPPVQEGEASADRGSRGEAAAARFLRCERGFRILAQNWHNPHDKREEIDLIAQKDGVIAFVEVKTRTAGALVPGYFAVGRRKKRALRGAIRAYLSMHFPRPRTYRFDVVEVEIGGGPPGIRHFENVGLFR
jgi:putative endonuclease